MATPESFIQAGLRLYPQYGYAKLSVRILAVEAGLSSGMFHHLFHDKDDFFRQLLARQYQTVFDEMLNLSISQNHALTQLKHFLTHIAFFTRSNVGWTLRLLSDNADGIPVIRTFFEEHVNHFRQQVIRQIIICQQQSSLKNDVSPIQIFAYLMAAINMPTIGGANISHTGVRTDEQNAYQEQICSNAAIEQRIEWALCAIQTAQHQDVP